MMAKAGRRRRKNATKRVKRRDKVRPASDEKASRIFMLVPIDRDFPPSIRRALSRRDMHLIYAFWRPSIANIFPFIILTGEFQDTTQAALSTFPGRNADSHP
jgi:hypothetical protein